MSSRAGNAFGEHQRHETAGIRTPVDPETVQLWFRPNGKSHGIPVAWHRDRGDVFAVAAGVAPTCNSFVCGFAFCWRGSDETDRAAFVLRHHRPSSRSHSTPRPRLIAAPLPRSIRRNSHSTLRTWLTTQSPSRLGGCTRFRARPHGGTH